MEKKVERAAASCEYRWTDGKIYPALWLANSANGEVISIIYIYILNELYIKWKVLVWSNGYVFGVNLKDITPFEESV